ncbi:AraC family transcriptional regulator [Vibrio penaeicida]|uniref:AraC family transcriptional regulator n=1 Tax=Vibrio penaeicida TaxID=104609 RepID=UPI000CEA4B0D|nr:helix-turn-helix domain-containing protein [Vibrio penaeicida]
MYSSHIIDTWQSKAVENKRAFIIPDGCQDVIITLANHTPAQINVSPLYTHTAPIDITAGTTMVGFRLQPGCNVSNIETDRLMQRWDSKNQLIDRIESATTVNPNVAEALECIRKEMGSIEQIASLLGVNVRTLQRTIKKHTDQTPLFWFRLARVRQCAKAIILTGNHSDIAYDYQYSDQAHMCREIKSWLGVTPTQLFNREDIKAQLFDDGY